MADKYITWTVSVVVWFFFVIWNLNYFVVICKVDVNHVRWYKVCGNAPFPPSLWLLFPSRYSEEFRFIWHFVCVSSRNVDAMKYMREAHQLLDLCFRQNHKLNTFGKVKQKPLKDKNIVSLSMPILVGMTVCVDDARQKGCVAAKNWLFVWMHPLIDCQCGRLWSYHHENPRR